MNMHQLTELIEDDLLDVTLPGRYVGGEAGVRKEMPSSGITSEHLHIGICFPDLYEIGMANRAVRILYDLANRSEGCFAEMVFPAAPDFAQVLKKHGLSLYSLESYTPVKHLDILAVSVGYELSATNILAVLDQGNVPLYAGDRREDDPIVIAGGPAVTNPIPLEDILDACYIGEAEAAFPGILEELRRLKSSGATRSERLAYLKDHPNIYMKGKTSAVRAVDMGFASRDQRYAYYVLPHAKVVQDHGAVEIMRGCPNGCRFCHAGMFYRPYRQLELRHIFSLTEHLMTDQGYNHITLTSLSTGDFRGIGALVDALNRSFSHQQVSFGLPSLKIDTFTLDILESVSRVRRSGLTFAVETPHEAGQRALNKVVSFSKVIGILKEAKLRGWNLAKFYFMIGLPGSDIQTIAGDIIAYLDQVRSQVRIALNVTVGTFIPKPHTPFQWAAQIREDEAREIFRRIKDHFRRNGAVKVSYHDPFMSTLEGLVSRGDRRAGELIMQAYRRGAWLDAWDEHFQESAWRGVIEDASWDVMDLLNPRNPDVQLPWQPVRLGVSQAYLKREYERTAERELTEPCGYPCPHPCGMCGPTVRPAAEFDAETLERLSREFLQTAGKLVVQEGDQARYIIIKYEKTGTARFLSHTSVMRSFERAFRRTGISLAHTRGFNPKPKMDFAQPLALGMESAAEYLLIQTTLQAQAVENLLPELSNALPEGFSCLMSTVIPKTGKYSLMARYGGSIYRLRSAPPAADVLNSPHVSVMERSEETVVIRVITADGGPDLLKITDDKYGFIKACRPVRLETLDRDGNPFDQSSSFASCQ